LFTENFLFLLYNSRKVGLNLCCDPPRFKTVADLMLNIFKSGL